MIVWGASASSKSDTTTGYSYFECYVLRAAARCPGRAAVGDWLPILKDDRVVTEEKPHDSDSLTQRQAIFLVIVLSLCHPWQALGELLRMISRATGRALGRAIAFALTPVIHLAVPVWPRNDSKGHTFEDYLHRTDEFED